MWDWYPFVAVAEIWLRVGWHAALRLLTIPGERLGPALR
jgi:hypothetical protein